MPKLQQPDDSIMLHDMVAAVAVAAVGVAITQNPHQWVSARLLLLGVTAGQSDALASGLCISAALSYGMQLVNFALSRFNVADNFTGLVEFLPAALIGLVSAGTYHPRQVLLTAMLSSWSLRLGLFLLGRMRSRSGPDGRMDNLRAMSGAVKVGLLSFWVIHGTWVRRCHWSRLTWVAHAVLTLLAAAGARGVSASDAGERPGYGRAPQCHRSAPPPDLSLLQAVCRGCSSHNMFADAVGTVIWAVGMAMEAVADGKKLASYQHDTPRYNLGGLWSWTRHPNFAGEGLIWVGAAVAASNLGGVWSYGPVIAAASPAMTWFLMLFEAGLLAEWKNNHRYGEPHAVWALFQHCVAAQRSPAPLLASTRSFADAHMRCSLFVLL